MDVQSQSLDDERKEEEQPICLSIVCLGTMVDLWPKESAKFLEFAFVKNLILNGSGNLLELDIDYETYTDLYNYIFHEIKPHPTVDKVGGLVKYAKLFDLPDLLEVCRDQMSDTFRRYCRSGNLSKAQYLYSMDLISQETIKKVFAGEILFTPVLEWLHTIGQNYFDSIYYYNHFTRNQNYQSNLDCYQFLHSTGRIIDVYYEDAFKHAVRNGNLEIVQWLYSTGIINLNKYDKEQLLIESCNLGHVDVFVWLHTHLNNEECSFPSMDYAFQMFCKHGKLEMVKSLHGRFEIDVHANNDYAFRWSCANGHLELAKWLYSLDGVDIHAVNNFALNRATACGHMDVVNWLYTKMVTPI